MSIDRRSRRQRSFQPSVGNLEERNLMSVGGVTDRIRPAAQVGGMIRASSNDHSAPMVTPLNLLAGEWRSRTWITKVFADQFPDVPATIDSFDTVSRQGNKLVGTESVSTFTADWEITRTRQGEIKPYLTMTVTTATRGSVELTGRRVGRNSWVFATDSTSAMQIRSVITIQNRDTYSFENFQATPDGVQLLYTTVHERMKGLDTPAPAASGNPYPSLEPLVASPKAPAAQVGVIPPLILQTETVTPITRLAGEWRSRTWITKVFADQRPYVPATINSFDTVSLQGNKLVGTESVGTFTAGWEITRTRQGLTMTVTTATRGSVELTGRRVGSNSWVFATDSTSAMQIRSVITIQNRDTYSFANFQATPDGVQLLYTSLHQRMKGLGITPEDWLQPRLQLRESKG
ncbi:MAG: hypothetical protein ACKO85_07245 [Isosphaeraceae bacterium]